MGVVAEAPFAIDDEVEIINAVPGRPDLRVGTTGVVVCAGEAAPWSLVSVEVRRGHTSRVWLLHPRHLRRVAE
jgi:hypothetical protein